jgi:catechol 2,3-dioxygenase-like lactoylglutathione lyase family enzyme
MRHTRCFLLAIAVTASHAVQLRGQQGASDAPTAGTLRIQSFSVIVTSYDEAKDWYTKKLGFVTVRDQAFGNGERFVEVAPPGQRDFGIVLQLAHSGPSVAEPEMRNDYSDRVGKQVNIVLYTNDVSAYADSLRTRGVKLTSPVRRMPWATQVTFQDLYGNSLVAIGPRSARAGGTE